jgi:hypothetical protein
MDDIIRTLRDLIDTGASVRLSEVPPLCTKLKLLFCVHKLRLAVSESNSVTAVAATCRRLRSLVPLKGVPPRDDSNTGQSQNSALTLKNQIQNNSVLNNPINIYRGITNTWSRNVDPHENASAIAYITTDDSIKKLLHQNRVENVQKIKNNMSANISLLESVWAIDLEVFQRWEKKVTECEEKAEEDAKKLKELKNNWAAKKRFEEKSNLEARQQQLNKAIEINAENQKLYEHKAEGIWEGLATNIDNGLRIGNTNKKTYNLDDSPIKNEPCPGELKSYLENKEGNHPENSTYEPWIKLFSNNNDVSEKYQYREWIIRCMEDRKKYAGIQTALKKVCDELQTQRDEIKQIGAKLAELGQDDQDGGTHNAAISELIGHFKGRNYLAGDIEFSDEYEKDIEQKLTKLRGEISGVRNRVGFLVGATPTLANLILIMEYIKFVAGNLHQIEQIPKSNTNNSARPMGYNQSYIIQQRVAEHTKNEDSDSWDESYRASRPFTHVGGVSKSIVRFLLPDRRKWHVHVAKPITFTQCINR